jgi:hypothetical protein
MRKLVLAAIVAIALAGVPQARPAEAQQLVTLVRMYPQHAWNGCLEYVAQWNDGSYTVVPWICPPGVWPVRNDRPVPAVRSWTERTRSGGIQYVALWADGVYTGVPAWYPPGLLPVKPGTAPFDAVVWVGPPPFWPAIPQGPAQFQPYPYRW